ncbi:acetamidase/formamidase family protein [Pseudonocardia sp. MH-G8]|uniref:acetamidase/formamidase family protein n=1 Tax=Pseudonocardia sp. MH-G8 TaxID=1854588 RepID=UPI000BA03BD0|nr:acetamidase/formamidase family protein [Pseudonocardia sp. MH-G8]OZM83107.1 acetamidase [Pseudonocardia sp. MH-G8]
MPHHHLNAPPHRLWSTEHEPAIVVGDGDTVAFEVQEALGGQFDGLRTGDPVPDLDWDGVYPMAGPIMVEGARPGDTLEIEIIDVRPVDWGWTAVLPGLGLLSEDFPDPYFQRWDLSDGSGVARLGDVAAVPIRPFFGVTGVCPQVDAPTPVLPPGRFGGNLDCRDLVAGSRLFLPVQVPDARLALGDPHAAQGDGELCVSAIETSAAGEIRVRLHRDRTIAGPQLQTPGGLRAGLEDEGWFATMGVGPDLMAAARDAARAMIDHLVRAYPLSPVEAYVLASVCVDLKITEVVDAPNWVVSAYLPLAVLS